MSGVYGTQGWGVYRSTDFGASFTHVGMSGGQNGVYGTAKFVYSQSGGASAGGIDQSGAERAALPDLCGARPGACHQGSGRRALHRRGR